MKRNPRSAYDNANEKFGLPPAGAIGAQAALRRAFLQQLQPLSQRHRRRLPASRARSLMSACATALDAGPRTDEPRRNARILRQGHQVQGRIKTLASSASSRRPLNEACRNLSSSVRALNSISATSSGRIQRAVFRRPAMLARGRGAMISSICFRSAGALACVNPVPTPPT